MQVRFAIIAYFNRFDKKGKMLCRKTGCNKRPKKPYSYYCSSKHENEFNRWYCDNFMWSNVRYIIFKRDNYTCQICKEQFPKPVFIDQYSYLECDHIIPRSVYQKLGYKIDTGEDLIKAYLEFFHNHKNLRSLCHECHKKVTADFLSKIGKRKTRKLLSYQLWLQKHLEISMQWFNEILDSPDKIQNTLWAYIK
jgi:5-methylcytosine-specific restriction endonuclease McrA